MSAYDMPLRPRQVRGGDVLGCGSRIEYVFERCGELCINACDEELVRKGKRLYGEESVNLYEIDLTGWHIIGHYGTGRGFEGRNWFDMGKPLGVRR